MRLLLDTNAFIWAAREPEMLSKTARQELLSPQNERYVSVASLWEMQIKQSIGKLPLPAPAAQLAGAWLPPIIARMMAIELDHLEKLATLPLIHRDPFDRMLVAQALSEGMSIVSPDRTFARYPVRVIW